MSEMNLRLRRETAEQLFDDFLYRTRGIRRDSSRKCVWRGFKFQEGHEPIVIRATLTDPGRARVRRYERIFVENDNQLQ